MRKSIFSILLCISCVINASQPNFEATDNYALSMRDYYFTTTELATTINDTNFNDIEKVRILFTWIAQNIIYDIESFEAGIRPSPLPENTLLNGMAVCYGYAMLFDSVCHKLGIRSFIVPGYVKNDFNPRSSNHAWNAVQLNKKWYFVDPTWGSGHIEKYGKKGIISSIFNLPTIKNQSVFVSETNNKFFLSTAEEISNTHMPADPMWQLNEYPQSLGCFMSGTDDCSYDSVYFNFSDTLNKFIYLDPEEQLISSAKRALKFNGYNYYDLASAYISVGMKHYNLLESIVPEAANYLKNELIKSYRNIDHGLYYLKIGQQIDDSIYRARITEFKNNYKTSSKILKSYRKITDKSISKNIKYLEKTSSEKNNIKQQLYNYRESAFMTSLDEKIYLIDRPKELADNFDSLKILNEKHKIDSIKLLIYKDMDTLEYTYNNDYKALFDSMNYFRNTVPEILNNLDTLNAALRRTYIENCEETFKNSDSIFYYSKSYYETLIVSYGILDNIVKQKIKEKHNLVKTALKSMDSKVKESKKYLIEIKKHSFLEHGEEEYYETLNNVFSSNYLKYVEVLEKLLSFYKEGKSTVKTENKMLEHHLKELNKTNDYLTTYYRYNYDQMKNRYSNEKYTIKQLSKTVSAAGNICVKTLGN